MDGEGMRSKWAQLAEEVFTGMAEWRVQHPKATFREIEAAVDERLAAVRARMLEDAALSSTATEMEGSLCPQCGHKLDRGSIQSRSLLTNYNQQVQLERRYATCPSCGEGLFPPG